MTGSQAGGVLVGPGRKLVEGKGGSDLPGGAVVFRFPLRRWTWLGRGVQGSGGAWKLQRKAGHRCAKLM